MAAESIAVSQVAIPDTVMAAFKGGLSLPVTVNTFDSGSLDSVVQADDDAVIGSATIKFNGSSFILLDINTEVGNATNKVRLSDKAQSQLLTAKGKSLSDSGWLVISNNIKLHLNPLTMHLELVVDRTFFGVDSLQRERVLPSSSARNFTSLFDYDVNAYTSRSQGVNSQAANLTFKSQSSLGEHHFDLEGSVLAGEQSLSSLNRAMYEYDANGHRFAAGMLDGWSMQGLSNVSTLGDSKMYGFSYGNASNSVKFDNSQSLTPIEVYFPSAGEARIYRDGRLLNVQRVSMGNHQLDTGRLPIGIYDVRVDTVIGGQVVSSRSYHVNKLSASKQYGDHLGWQFWGGILDRKSDYYSWSTHSDGGLTPIGGISLAGYWRDTNWNMSLYQVGRVSVEEGLATWQPTSSLRFDLQNLYSSDKSKQWSFRGSYDLPYSIASLWAYRQRGSSGDELPFYAQSYDSAGLSVNLGNWINKAGTLNFSYEKEVEQSTEYLRTDYNQMIYSGRFGTAQLQLGMSGESFSNTNNQYYATINFTLPLSADFQIGLSQQGSLRELDLQAGKSIDNSVINYVGANVSTAMSNGEKSSNYGAYADYSGRYGQGSLSYSGSKGSSSLSLSNHGQLALSRDNFAAGGGSGDAALVVDMPKIKTGDLEAVLDGQSYPLASGENVISLSAYNTYHLNIRSSELSDSSYQITDNGSRNITLYPGNVVAIKPSIKQMVTVFGRLVDESGKPLKHAKINNHIGITTSDQNGNFAVDVDKRHPRVTVKLENDKKFDMVMNLSSDNATKWLGTVRWAGNNIYLNG